MLTTKQGIWTPSEVAAWMALAGSANRREASPSAHRALKALLNGISTETYVAQATKYIERMSTIRF